MKFGDCAELITVTENPSDIEESTAYVGLKHIAQERLRLCGIGHSADITTSKSKFRKGDILFGKLRPYFRKVAIPDFDGICSTDIWVIRPKANTDPKFLFYWCASWDFVNFLNAASEGTRMPRAKWDVALTHEIRHITISEQKVISHILGTLDDKIEINHQMNATLEEMAKTIFKSWFVNFDPVRAKMNGQPIGLCDEISDLFPSKLVNSEVGEIPEGWEVKQVNCICDRVKLGFANGQEWSSEKLIDLGRMPKKAISLCEYGKGDSLKTSICRFKKYDFLFGSIRPYFFKAGIAPFDGITNSSVFILRVKRTMLQEFLYFLASSDDIFKKSVQYSSGTKMPVISWKDFSNFDFVLPSDPLVEKFSYITSPMVERIIYNIHENFKLTELRDLLLPKLISGQLRIRDAEKFLERAGV